MPEGRGFNIGNFAAFRNNAGLLKSHDFHIVITWPAALLRLPEFLAVERNMELICDSINFPSVGAATYNVQRYSYGAIETKPTIPKFSPLQATFTCDEPAAIYKYFHAWVKATVNYDFGTSIASPSSTLVTGSATPYEISYKEEYMSDLYLHIYDQYGNEVRRVMFREAYPTDVGDVLFSWGRQNEYVKLPVVFTFVDMQDVFIQ